MTRRTLIVTPRAITDLIEQAEFIGKDRLEASLRFLDQAEATFEFLAENAEVGVQRPFKHPHLANIHVWPIKEFRNWLIFYQFELDSVKIVRILHGARDIESIFE